MTTTPNQDREQTDASSNPRSTENAAMKYTAGMVFASRISRAGWRFALLLVLCLGPIQLTAAGTWLNVTNLAPGNVQNMILLSDGTVMAQNQGGTNWYRLTPSSTGGYTNGTWSTITPMHDTRTFFATVVLKDGRVFAAGGEYGTGGATAEIYNPVANSWTQVNPPAGLLNPAGGQGFLDSSSEILKDGRVLLYPINPGANGTLIYDPVANTWTGGPTPLDNREASWVKLPDDSILTIGSVSLLSCARYIPSTVGGIGSWVSDTSLPVNLFAQISCCYPEIGPAFLLANGKMIYMGGNTNTALYTPSGSSSPGTWAVGPNFPAGLSMADSAGAMMVNGKILCALAGVPYMSGANLIFPQPTSYYEYDPVANSFAQVGSPTGGLTENIPTYLNTMLDLPDGTVLHSDYTNRLHVYVPGGSPLAAGKPGLASIASNGNGSFHLTGTGLNGISEGASFGDDLQMNSNYPLVRFTDGSGNVRYGRTFNWSSTGVMTGTNLVSTDFTLPSNLPPGSYLEVVANGIASDPVAFNLSDTPTVSFVYPTNNTVFSANAAPQIFGYADDTNASIKSVRVALNRDADAVWYDFVSGGWGTTTFDFNRNVLNASGVSGPHTGWSAQLPNLAAGNYTVQAQSVNLFNASAWASRNFAVIPPPVVTFSPLTNQQVVFNFDQLGGSVSETGTVKFQIEWFRAAGNMFWNGANWTSVASDPGALLTANLSGLNWTPAPGTLPPRYQLAQANYVIHVYATNDVGDGGYNDLVLTRSAPDTTPPIVTLDTIHNGDVLTNAVLPGLFGSALDYESGIASVNVYLNRFSNGDILYWNGSIWTSSPAALTAAYNAQTVAWQVTNSLPSGANLPNAAYQVQVSVQNNEAPAGSKLLSVSFTVDYHPVYVFNYGSQFGPTPNMNWDSPDNWDVGLVPYPDVRVVINGYSPVIPGALGVVQVYGLDMSGGTLSMSEMLIKKLNFYGGQINGGALTLTNNGTNIWSGGNLNVAKITVLGGSTLIITNNVNHDLENCTITNNGTIVWNGGPLQGGGYPGTVVQNYGLWDNQGDWNLNNAHGGNGTVFNNYGTFRKSVGTTNSQSAIQGGVYFNQLGGVLDVQQGNFSLQGGAYFGGGYVTTNSTGTTILAAGAFNLNGAVTSSNVIQNGGYLAGNNVLHSEFTWLAGSWSGATMAVTANSTVYLAGAGNLDLENTFVTNNGTVLWDSGLLVGGGYPGTQIYNNGLWDIQGDLTWNNGHGGNGTTFNNYGILRKSLGSNTNQAVFAGGVYFNQWSGVLDVQRGNFSLQSGAYFGGGFVTTNSTGTTILAAGAFNINGAVTSSNLVQNGGYLVGNNFLHGTLTWLAGSWSSAIMTVTTNSALYLAGALNLDLENTFITNNGTVLWDSGLLVGGGYPGTQIYNNGLWDIQGDLTWNNGHGGNGTLFNNYGVLRKSVGTNTNQTTFTSGVYLNQLAGVLDVQQGNFSLQSGAYFGGGYVTTNSTGTTILAVGAFNINGAVTSSNVVENTGYLAGNNVIRVALTWLAGGWSGATITVSSNSTLYLAGGGNLDVENTVVTNNGILLWRNGLIVGGGYPGTQVYNNGLWDIQGDLTWNYGHGGNGTLFNNYATLRKSAGTNTSQTLFTGGVNLNQSAGVLDVQLGNFVFQGGVGFNGGYVTTNSAGTTILAGGFNLNGSVTASNVVENGGYPSGNNVLRGALTWLAGSWSGVTMTVSSNSTLYLAGGGNLDVENSVLTNNGTVLWSNGLIVGGGYPGTQVYNNGLWDIQGDLIWNYGHGGNGTLFNNYAALRKSSGTNTSQTLFTGGVNLNQSAGVLDVRQGNFVFQGGVGFNGGYVTTNSTGTIILAGSFNLNGSVTASNVVENGGYPSGNNVLLGALTWLAGSWSGVTMTVSSNSTLYLAGSGNLDVENTMLTNNGTVFWSNGLIVAGGYPGTLVCNYGLWDVQGDSTWNYGHGGNGTTFNNYGIFSKELSVGTTTFTPGANFNNPGTVDLRSGTMAFNGAVYLGPTSKLNLVINGPSPGTQFGSESFGFPPPFDGTLAVVLANGYVPTNGQSFTFASYPSRTGQFSVLQLPPLPAVSQWQLVYNPGSLVLQVVPSTAFQSSSLTNGNFQFTFVGQTGSSCLVEVSTNLFNWTPLFTNTPFNGTLDFVDPQTAQFPMRFYRAKVIP